ncbi:MAG: hypothetical protein R6V56_02995 [Lentisphaeria bacterium]
MHNHEVQALRDTAPHAGRGQARRHAKRYRTPDRAYFGCGFVFSAGIASEKANGSRRKDERSPKEARALRVGAAAAPLGLSDRKALPRKVVHYSAKDREEPLALLNPPQAET